LRLLSEEQLRGIEEHLQTVLRRELTAPGMDGLRIAVSDYVAAGGKRIRPQLAIWTAIGAGSTLTPAVLDIASGWELFHAFLLVHDDIIDGADRRRDQPSLHYSLAHLDGGSLTFGTNLAIVAGDLLFSTAMKLWHEADVEPACYRPLLKLFSRIACTTGFGQAVDICASHLPMDQVDEETLLREYHWKTAAYTFEGPMLSGAILAGLNERAQQAISRFALSLGQAYQLQNDLIDLSMPATPGCDLVQGKRTVTLIRYRAGLSGSDRLTLDGRIASLSPATDDAVMRAESLRHELLERDVMRPTRELIRSLLADARHAAASADLPARLALGMRSMLDLLADSYFGSPETTSA
jgi:geranylgeranyl diphosphate synthase, type I